MPGRPPDKALTDFVAEAQEVAEALHQGLTRLEDTATGGEADPDTLNSVFRAAHSLKGLAAMFGVERMTALAHALEERLDDVRMGRSPLDPESLGLLLSAPPLFSAMLAEEAGGKPPATEAAARELAGKLRAGPPPPAAPADPIDGVELDETVRSVLTEYEEHRLRANLAKGFALHRVRVAFDISTFDTGLDELKKRLKAFGEVVSTLPSAEVSDPESISFDVLFASGAPAGAVREAAGKGTVVDEIPRRGAGATGASGAALGEPPAATLVTETEASAARSRPASPPSQGARGSDASADGSPARAPRSTARGPTAPKPTGPRPAPQDRPAPSTTAPGPAAPRTAPPPASVEGSGARVAEPRRAAAPAASAPPPLLDESLRSASQAVRVDIHKLDRLMNLVGELVIAKTSLAAIAQRLRGGEDSTALGHELHRETRVLERKLTELQSGILEVRMVPVGQIFDKLSRMVRKLARDLGKHVLFETKGGEVELDKLIVEDLSDPFMHLIRNSLDHGIGSPEARASAGKPPAGTITLSAAQKGNHVLVSVSDDGAGIDEERIRRTAVERGLATAEGIAQLSRREVMNLIFLPGFSTAAEVTALSGRGVGLDVVKNNVAAMSGLIDLHTELGKGTRFDITLPVTLAIIRALVVTAAGRTYAVPLNSVLEIVTVEPAELRSVEAREVLDLRGATLPLVRLGRFFGSAAASPPGALFVVIVGLAQDRLGVAVDSLVGQQDIVMKPLGSALSGVRGIAGATDLGGRRTVLVIDVGSVIEEVLHGGERLVEMAR